MSVLPCLTWAELPSQPHPAPPPPRPHATPPHLTQANTGAQPQRLPPHHHQRLPSLCSRGLMGNLLKVLACTELEHGPIVFLDFERETIRFFFFCFLSVAPFLFVAFAVFSPPHHSISLSQSFSILSPFFFLTPPPLGSSSLPFDLGSRDWHLASF